MSCSVGVCFLPAGLGDYSYEQLLEHADLALYRAKIAGRNQYAVGEKLIPLDTGNKGETAVKLLMDETMEKREFEIYFQPKISLHNYKIVGAEALVRWRRPDGIVDRNIFFRFMKKMEKSWNLIFMYLNRWPHFWKKQKEAESHRCRFRSMYRRCMRKIHRQPDGIWRFWKNIKWIPGCWRWN